MRIDRDWGGKAMKQYSHEGFTIAVSLLATDTGWHAIIRITTPMKAPSVTITPYYADIPQMPEEDAYKHCAQYGIQIIKERY
jgi:hypothetical protein